MRRFWEWLGLNLGKHAGIVAVVGLAVTFVLGLGVTKLQFSTSNSDYLNKNDPPGVNNQHYTQLFGGDPMAVLFTMNQGKTVDNLFTPAEPGRDAADRDRARTRTPGSSASSPRSTPWGSRRPCSRARTAASSTARPRRCSSPPTPRHQRQVGRRSVGTTSSPRPRHLRKFSADQQVLSNPKWMHFVIHEPNGTVRKSRHGVRPQRPHALMAIYLKPNLDINQETKAAAIGRGRSPTRAHFENATTFTTGVPEILKVINDYLKDGIKRLGSSPASIMVDHPAAHLHACAGGCCPSPSWPSASSGPSAWSGSSASRSPWPPSRPCPCSWAWAWTIRSRCTRASRRRSSSTAPPTPSRPPRAASGPALLVVTFDAVFAFMALWFAKIPAIRQFGSLMVIGIIAVCVCSIIAHPGHPRHPGVQVAHQGQGLQPRAG